MTMLVKTINPVIVNRKDISEPSKYLSFDGRKASKDQLKAFQAFANKKGMTPKLVVDGIYGKNTQKAIDIYGPEWDKMGAVLANIATGGAPSGSSTPSAEEQAKMAKAGKVWDKAKGWIESGKAQSAVDTAKGLFGSIFGKKDSTQETTTSQEPIPVEDLGQQDQIRKANKRAKAIAIGVGVAAVLGIIIYVATRPKKGK